MKRERRTDRGTDRQRDRQKETERQTQRNRDRQTDRQRQTDRESNCRVFVNQKRGESYGSARKNRTTKKKSSVGRDLRKSPKKRLRREWNRIEC